MAEPESHVPSAYWPAFWLGVVSLGAKAAHWSLPALQLKPLREYVTDVVVSAHADLLFAAGFGLLGELALRACRRRPRLRRALWWTLVALGLVGALFAVASVQIFAYLRSPLTYPLLYLAGDMRAMRSSLGSFLSPWVWVGLLAAPAGYLLLVRSSVRLGRRLSTRGRRRAAALLAVSLLAAVGFARWQLAGRWLDRDDHLIVRSPHWAFVSSCVRELAGAGTPKLDEPFPVEHLEAFAPPRSAAARGLVHSAGPPPRNVVVVVLETTGTRYLGLYGSRYPTTPRLQAESAHAAVVDGFYCHVGLTANSLASILLSIYPYMTWREYTVEYPEYPGQTLAQILGARGYRSAFMHNGDLGYTNQRAFLAGRGFDVLWGLDDLGPDARWVSSWGGEDRVLVDAFLRWVDAERGKPFHALLWTIGAHHPYEPVPGQELIDFFGAGERPPDDYDLGRYLNTLRETDRQLGRLFDGLRARGLDQDTLVVVTGDHGEAFGEPHATWGHGARLYEENVSVPLMLWNPRLFPQGLRLERVAGHVDLNPTLAGLLGLPPAPTWQGRSLFDPERPQRTYFYAANDDYLLGVRERSLKYVWNVTRGRDELYDLAADPEEQRNLAPGRPESARDLRHRLLAWREFVRRQLEASRPAAG